MADAEPSSADAGPDAEPIRVRPSAAARLRQLAPWAVAAVLLWLVFRQVPAADAWRAAREARLGFFVAVALGVGASFFVLESRALAYLFTRFNAAVSWAEARALRGVTYLVTPVHWNLGTAAIVLHLRYSKDVSALDSASSLLLYSLIDGLVLSSLVLAGCLLLPAGDTTAILARSAALVLGTLLVLMAMLMTRRPHWGWLERLRGLGVLRSHTRARIRDVLLLASLRSLYFAAFVLFFKLGASAFGVSLPLAVACAVTPIILMVGALPITPSGLGTQQAAMLYFFAPYGSEAAILAFALALPAGLIGSRIPIGLLYLRTLRGLRTAG